MPLYDRRCLSCEWTAIDQWEATTPPIVACPSCQQPTERAWFSRATTVIGDEMDHVQHNGTRVPIRFRSKLEFARWLKAHDYRIQDTHVPVPGTDKSKFTTSWGSRMDPYTANNVRILLERAFHAPPTVEEEPLNMNIRTYTGTLTKEEVEHYARRA